MRKPVLVGLLLCLAVAAVFCLSGRNPSFDLTQYNALGAGAADATADLLGKNSQVMVIVPQATANSPSVHQEVDCFQKTINRRGISTVRTVSFRLATPLEVIESGGLVPREQLLGVLQSSTKIGAVVLFCGFPNLSPQDFDILKQTGTKIIVASGYQPAFYNLLRARVIDLAIVPKVNGSPVPTKKAHSLREVFDSEFTVLTYDNIETFTTQARN